MVIFQNNGNYSEMFFGVIMLGIVQALSICEHITLR